MAEPLNAEDAEDAEERGGSRCRDDLRACTNVMPSKGVLMAEDML